MSLWEYKHITSGPHGFATPALLESYLNQLGKDEWEIISYHTLPNNPLAFTGVARRTTLRDWTLETAAAAAAKVEADKIRAEFAAKFQGSTSSSVAAEAPVEKPATLISETAAPEDGFRKLRDTERDSDPDAAEEGDDWDNWDNLDDDLPTFFEAIKPHLRKNQRGPGQSVGITFLAKRWEQTEGDLIGALKECGFVVPEREDDPPVHLEFEGELYWLNLNNRHELFLNTREKPRPVFRVVQAKKLDPADPAAAVLAEEVAAEQAEKAKREAERLAREAEHAARRAENEARRAAAQAAAVAAREAAQAAAAAKVAAAGAAPATADEESSESASIPVAVAAEDLPPEAEDFLTAVRAQMRRNRRGPGYSGSITYLARAFKQTEADLVEMFVAVGLAVPEAASDKPVKTQIGAFVYWLNKDSRGAIWINGDEVRAGGGEPQKMEAGVAEDGGSEERAPELPAPAAVEAAPTEPAPVVAATAAPELPEAEPVAEPVQKAAVSLSDAPSASVLTGVRLLLKPNKRGSGVSAEVGYLARTLDQDLQVFLTTLTNLGLALPATEEDKPSFVENADEIFWLNKNPKDGSVWLNAKTSKAGAKKAAGGAAKPKAKKAAKPE
ncbi:MAG: hypothetical protein K0R17_489 [Rariglobus sp.]|jgi:hypothetical protein|nr:hypothetical protein [Rariglobus sp.]